MPSGSRRAQAPSEAAAQKGKGGAPQAPPAGKGPQTVPPRGWLTQSEPEQTQPEAAQEKLLGRAQPSMFQLPSASEMPRDDGVRRVLSVDHSVLPQRVTDFVQTTEELMGKDPSASLTKMALVDTNVLSDDVASELAAKTAQLDSLDQAVLSLQGDIQLLRQSSAELATQKEKLSTLLAELEKPSQAEAATEVAQEAEAQKPSAQAVVEQLKLLHPQRHPQHQQPQSHGFKLKVLSHLLLQLFSPSFLLLISGTHQKISRSRGFSELTWSSEQRRQQGSVELLRFLKSWTQAWRLQKEEPQCFPSSN